MLITQLGNLIIKAIERRPNLSIAIATLVTMTTIGLASGMWNHGIMAVTVTPVRDWK